MGKTTSQPDSIGEPGQTLITYNLLNSALACIQSKHEKINLIQIEDFCTFTDLFCIYDNAVLLGHNWKWYGPDLAKRNNLAAALAEYEFIHEIDQSNVTRSVLTQAHAKHLAAFLEKDLDAFTNKNLTIDNGLEEDYIEFGVKDDYHEVIARPTDLMEHLFHKAANHITNWDNHVHLGGPPDTWLKQIGWVRTVPEKSAMVAALAQEAGQNQRMHKLIMRTFVYLAYADMQRISFTPDTARHPVIEGIVAEENQFRGKLQAMLKNSVAETTPGDKDLLRRVPPLAAILFERSHTIHDIVPELIRLRNDLAPLRKTLRNLEKQMLLETHDTAIKTLTKWNQAIEEVERNFGLEPRLITYKTALQLGESLGDAIDKPTSINSWSAALAQLPADVINRLIARQTLVELHKLRPELPASERLRKSIQRVFTI